MSSAKSEFLEWFLGGAADIIKLIRDDKRTVGQFLPLKEAMQAIINNEYFEVNRLALKVLLKSNEPAHLQEGWRAIYARMKLECEVPLPRWESSLIESERKKGRIPIYLAPEIAYLEGISALAKGLNIPNRIPVRGLKWNSDYKGWLFTSSTKVPPNNCGFSVKEIKELWRKASGSEVYSPMTLNMFMVLMGYHQAMYDPLYDLNKTCFEVLLGSTYGKDHYVIVEYSDFKSVRIHRGALPDGVMLGARSVVQYESAVIGMLGL